MTAEQFAYWLQGYSEIAGEAPTAEQWQVIQDHLAAVFTKVTPDRSGYFQAPETWISIDSSAIANPHTARALC